MSSYHCRRHREQIKLAECTRTNATFWSTTLWKIVWKYILRTWERIVFRFQDDIVQLMFWLSAPYRACKIHDSNGRSARSRYFIVYTSLAIVRTLNQVLACRAGRLEVGGRRRGGQESDSHKKHFRGQVLGSRTARIILRRLILNVSCGLSVFLIHWAPRITVSRSDWRPFWCKL